MDLERVAAVIRPRSHWEAIDLGYGMVRRWWRPVYGVWAAVVLPVWVAVFLASHGNPWWGFFLLWWLKPIFDRLPLFVVSRTLFGVTPGVGETLRALPRILLGHTPAALFLYRLDPNRSFNLPVWQLEGLRGRLRRQRAAVLKKDGQNAASWLIFACFSMEWMMLLALFGLLGIMIPETMEFSLFAPLETYFEGGAPLWFHLLVGGVYFLAVSLVEPFYVAGGFALYLNRRVHLEGWDVELAFRRLAYRVAVARAEEAGPGEWRRALAGVLVALCLGGMWAQELVAAQEASGTVPSAVVSSPQEGGDALPPRARPPAAEARAAPLDPDQAIEEVLGQPEFDTTEVVSRWRLRREFDPQLDLEPRRPNPLALNLGRGLEIVLWGAVAVAIALALVYASSRVRIGPGGGRGRAARVKPQVLFGLDVRAESLPDDVPKSALALWEKGDYAGALGLLYRAALSSLVNREDLRIENSWTEGDCVRQLHRRLSPARSHYLVRLTRSWQSTAYAHRPPAEPEFRRLAEDWPPHFGETP